MSDLSLRVPVSLTPTAESRSSLPKVYLVVLNWNGSSDTLACLDSVAGLTYPNFCLVLCDNDSRQDDLRQLLAGLERRFAQIHQFSDRPQHGWPRLQDLGRSTIALLHTGGNLGYAGGMNAGMRFALDQGDADYVWILNNDTAVAPGALDALVQRLQQDEGIGICGSSLIYHGDRAKVQALGGASYQPWRGRSAALGAFSAVCDIPQDPSAVERRMDYVVGAAMLVSKAFLDTVGPMDERYFLYSEEHDWAHRGRQLGFRLGWAPGSVVFHKHGATIGTAASGGSALSLFYLYRNKALFTARHHAWRLPVVLPWLAWDGLKFLLKGHPRKAVAAWRGLLAFPTMGRFPAGKSH